MFGMLDYRAFQLYRILFFVPNTVLAFVGLLGCPFGSYALALYFYRDIFGAEIEKYWLFIFAIISYFIVSTLLLIILTVIDKIFVNFFSIFIDVIPGDERTEAEAQFVLKTGKAGVHELLMNATRPENWTDEMINKSINYADWVQGWFYSANARDRLYAIREQCLYEDEKVSADNIEDFLKSKDLEKDWFEWLLADPRLRNSAVGILIFIYLLSANPWM